MIAIEFGSDHVITYVIEDGKLEEIHVLKTTPGIGSRHITLYPNGKFAYVMTELSCEVLTLYYNENEGHFIEQRSICTIPEGFRETNEGSALHISSDGQFVYAGNRGHNRAFCYKK